MLTWKEKRDQLDSISELAGISEKLKKGETMIKNVPVLPKIGQSTLNDEHLFLNGKNPKIVDVLYVCNLNEKLRKLCVT